MVARSAALREAGRGAAAVAGEAAREVAGEAAIGIGKKQRRKGGEGSAEINVVIGGKVTDLG